MAQHTPNYRLEVPVTDIRNQCAYGGCWAYRSIAQFERAYHLRTGKQVRLSEPFLLVHDLLSKSLQALRSEGQLVEPGGEMGGAEFLARRYGLIPAEVWQPRVPFERAEHAERLLNFLNQRIARFHIEAEGVDQNRREDLRKQAVEDVKAILTSYTGEIPPVFQYEGKSFTVESFGKEVLDERELILVTPLSHASPIAKPSPSPGPAPAPSPGPGTKPPPPARVSQLSVKHAATMQKDWPTIEGLIVHMVIRGEAVPVSFEVAREYIDHATGIMSIGAFPAPEGVRPVPRSARAKYRLRGGSHAAEIVGVDVDAEGNIVKFKVRNSYGERSGDGGYYHMYPDYFREYVTRVYVRRVPPVAKLPPPT